MPNPAKDLSQQLFKMNIAEQELQIQKQKTAIIELVDRKRNNEENIRNALKNIEELTKQQQNTDDTKINKQRIAAQKAAQLANIERQKLENLEGTERALIHEEQLNSAIKSKLQYETDLKNLEDAHGIFDESMYNSLKKYLFTD